MLLFSRIIYFLQQSIYSYLTIQSCTCATTFKCVHRKFIIHCFPQLHCSSAAILPFIVHGAVRPIGVHKTRPFIHGHCCFDHRLSINNDTCNNNANVCKIHEMIQIKYVWVDCCCLDVVTCFCCFICFFVELVTCAFICWLGGDSPSMPVKPGVLVKRSSWEDGGSTWTGGGKIVSHAPLVKEYICCDDKYDSIGMIFHNWTLLCISFDWTIHHSCNCPFLYNSLRQREDPRGDPVSYFCYHWSAFQVKGEDADE